MNVALVVGDFLSGSNALSVRGQAAARQLAACGHNVTVFCGRDSGSYKEKNIIVRRAWVSLPTNNLSLWRRIAGEFLLGLHLSWLVLFSKKEHVIVTTPPFIVMLVVTFFLGLFRTRYTLDVRDLYPEVYANAGLLSPTGFLYRAVDRSVDHIYFRSSNIVTVTSELALHLKSRLEHRNVLVAMNGYVSSRFYPKEPALIANNNRVTVISHGNFGELFDIASFEAIALALAKTVKVPYEIVLVGFGKKLAELRARNLPNVRVLAALTQEKVAELVRAADVGLSLHLPYNKDISGFPVKVFEFLGCGMPCVVMPENEGGRLIRDLGFGFSFNRSEVALAIQSIQMLIEDSARRSKMAAHICSQRHLFSLEGQVQVFSEILRSEEATPGS
jgi:glycosyltransferase involved in cell wall biosynthesis